jgi:hypothetical protein
VALCQRFPGTPSSGLAHLLAGLRLLEAGRPAEALAQLTHPDVQLTALRERALLGLGRAQEALRQADAAARSYLAAGPEPASAVACVALPKAAELFARAAARRSRAALEQTARSCVRHRASTSAAYLARGSRCRGAAFDQLDRERSPPEAKEARPGSGLRPARPRNEPAFFSSAARPCSPRDGRPRRSPPSGPCPSRASLPPRPTSPE